MAKISELPVASAGLSDLLEFELASNTQGRHTTLSGLKSSMAITSADISDVFSSNSDRARANHTGTQLMSTISDSGALALLDEAANSDLADMLQNTIKLRNSTGAGTPEDVAILDLSPLTTPGAGDVLMAMTSGGALRKVDVTDIPGTGGSGEANTSSNAGIGTGIALAKSGVNLPFATFESTEFSLAVNLMSLVGAGVKVAYEGEPNTNEFGDALLTKLNNIVPLAEPNTASSLGGGVSVFASKLIYDLRFNSFTSAEFQLIGNLISLADNAVTNAKANDMPSQTIKMRNTAGAGSPEDVLINSLTDNPSPISSDAFLTMTVGGLLRKVELGSIPITGEANTTSDLGGGVSITNTKVGIDLPFSTFSTLEFSLAANLVSLLPAGVTNAKLANVGQYTIKMRNTVGTGATQDLLITALSDKALPVAGDTVLGSDAAGVLQRYDVTNLPASGEVNTSSNVGGGLALALAKSAFNLPFRTLNTNEFAESLDVVSLLTGGVANAKLASMVQNTIKLRNSSGTGAPEDVAISALTDNPSPAAGDILLAMTSGGALRKIDVTNLPTGGGGEANTYSDAAAGISLRATSGKVGVDLPFRALAVAEFNEALDVVSLDPAGVKTVYESNADTNAFTDAEQTKLGGIESLATQDQTDAEIKTAYENNADTNAFDDAEQARNAASLQQGAFTYWVAESGFTPTVTAGMAARATREVLAGAPDISYLEALVSTPNHAQYSWDAPNGWDKGQVRVRVHYTGIAGAGTVGWQVAARAMGNGQAIGVAFPTATALTLHTFTTADFENVTAYSGAVTIDNTPVDGDRIVFDLATTNVGTRSVAVQLLGLTLEYTMDKDNDA